MWDRLVRIFHSIVAASGVACFCAVARADIDPNSGIDFVHIGAAGNAPYTNTIPNSRANGHGSVGYEYNIGKTEVTTSQWVAFMNAAYDRPANDRFSYFWLYPPDHWGATPATPQNSGGQRWTVPAGRENYPVGDISWRMAAMYTNWLNNNKSFDRSAFLSGAYDVSTFVTLGGEQQAHTPGARYWIPTWDEWMKAAHYDPNRNGPGQGGYWTYSITSETTPVYGPPGVTVNGQIAQANAGWDSGTYPGLSPYNVPLGSYPMVVSPWGLLDTAGAAVEFTETVFTTNDGTPYRANMGSAWLEPPLSASIGDAVYGYGGELSYIPAPELGLRIASSVPSPALGLGVFVTLSLSARRRRISCEHGRLCRSFCCTAC